MKIAIISDLHFGIRSDNISLLDHMNVFFNEIFFPYIESNNIDTIIIPGDLVDRRKYINYYTAYCMRTEFLNKLKNKNVYIIAGNHDLTFKSTNEISALNELLQGYNFNIYHDPEEVMIDDKKFLMLPWICDSNRDKSMQMINESNASIVVAHLELQGYEMNRKGEYSEFGLSDSLFNKFDMVITGHFHHRSSKHNIHYVGCPYEMSWADYGDSRGFHILDTDTLDLTFIPNKLILFNKIIYDDKDKSLNDIFNFDFDRFKSTYVRLYVKNKEQPYYFELFLEKLEKVGTIDVQIIEDLNIVDVNSTDEIEIVDDTFTLLEKEIKNSKISSDKKNKLISIMNNIYYEAMTVE